MSNLRAALEYATAGLPVFPMVATNGRKVPTTEHGFRDATRDVDLIAAWWGPNQGWLVAMPTGAITGRVVLDVDVKNGVCGWDALENLGALPLPHTPHAHTPSGGCHIHFAAPA
ncbi:MAG: hypothetical protein GC191_18595 [Azospirillum sp.]|nr:hypothetical protein [Azospirillum sp.]